MLQVAQLATSRKIVYSIPCGVIGIFRLYRTYGGPGVDSASNEYQVYLLGRKGDR